MRLLGVHQPPARPPVLLTLSPSGVMRESDVGRMDVQMRVGVSRLIFCLPPPPHYHPPSSLVTPVCCLRVAFDAFLYKSTPCSVQGVILSN